MTSKDVTIQNRAGLHARPAAMIVETANKYKSDVYIEKDGNQINAKSIIGILTLGASFKTLLTLSAEGEDEEEAVTVLAQLFDKKFEGD